MRLTLPGSPLMLAAMLVAFPVSAANPPPFCVVLKVPPASCQAEKALPCTGACPEDFSNNPAEWRAYWNLCRSQPEGDGFSLAQKQFMCDAPKAGELHILYYTPVSSYLCCIKNPFNDTDRKEGKNPPATGDPL